jgi:hypothetical protein
MVTLDDGLAVDFAVVNYGKWIKQVCIVCLFKLSPVLIYDVAHCIPLPL